MPDSGIEYEIMATVEELKEIEALFIEKSNDAKNAVKYLKKPFHEWGADDKREKYDDHLIPISPALTGSKNPTSRIRG